MEVDEADAEDVAVLAFLIFLNEQMGRHPELIKPLDEALARADELVGRIPISLDEDLGDVLLP